MEWIIVAVIAVLIALPPKYDPAIRWKERNERKRMERDKNMARPWRESVTATEQPDGTVSVKLHGFPMWIEGATFEEALQRTGKILDEQRATARALVESIMGKTDA